MTKYWLPKSLWGLNSLFPCRKYKLLVKFFIRQVLFLLGAFLVYSCIPPLHFYLCPFITEVDAGKWRLESYIFPGFQYCPFTCPFWLALNKISCSLNAHLWYKKLYWNFCCPWISYKCLDSFLSNLKVVGKEKYPLLVQSSPCQGNPMFKKDLESQIIASYSFPTQIVARSFVTLEILSLLKE